MLIEDKLFPNVIEELKKYDIVVGKIADYFQIDLRGSIVLELQSL